jgi:hypothetical protein
MSSRIWRVSHVKIGACEPHRGHYTSSMSATSSTSLTAARWAPSALPAASWTCQRGQSPRHGLLGPPLDIDGVFGPAGKYQYVSEQIDHPAAPGSILQQGQGIARFAASGTGFEFGWATATPGQTLAQSTTGYTEGQFTLAGSFIRLWLKRAWGGRRTRPPLTERTWPIDAAHDEFSTMVDRRDTVLG